MALIAVRLIDLAIFASLGTLWIGGAIFIVVLYRWILRFERERDPIAPDAVPVEAELAATPEPERAEPERIVPRVLPSNAHGALVGHV